MPTPRRNMHEAAASQLAHRINRHSRQVLEDLVHRRAVSLDGLQMSADIARLIQELTILRELDEQAARASKAVRVA